MFKEKIVIIGGGSAGWVSAAILDKILDKKLYDITLIESPDIKPIGVGESTVVAVTHIFEKILEWDEKEWMTACNATYKQGGRFVDFYKKDDSFEYPFQPSKVREPIKWFCNFYEGENTKNSFHKLCYVTPNFSEANKLTLDNGYAHHLNADLLAEFIKKKLGDRITYEQDEVITTDFDKNGNLESVSLKKFNKKIIGDYFIDCTGFKKILENKEDKSEYISFDDVLLNNQAVTLSVPYRTQKNELQQPYTKCTGKEAGWLWDIPLYDRASMGYVHSTNFTDTETAKKVLQDYIVEKFNVKPSSKMFNDIRTIKFKTGYYKEAWKNNVISVGLSAGFVEPLESTGIFLATKGALNVAHLLNNSGKNNKLKAEIFNRDMRMMWEEVRDFVLIHYIYSKRTEPYWREMKKIKNFSTELIKKVHDMTFFMVYNPDNTYRRDILFGPEGWHCIMIGMNQVPSQQVTKGYAPSHFWSEEFRKELVQRQKEIVEEAKQAPTMSEYLDEHIYNER